MKFTDASNSPIIHALDHALEALETSGKVYKTKASTLATITCEEYDSIKISKNLYELRTRAKVRGWKISIKKLKYCKGYVFAVYTCAEAQEKLAFQASLTALRVKAKGVSKEQKVDVVKALEAALESLDRNSECQKEQGRANYLSTSINLAEEEGFRFESLAEMCNYYIGEAFRAGATPNNSDGRKWNAIKRACDKAVKEAFASVGDLA